MEITDIHTQNHSLSTNNHHTVVTRAVNNFLKNNKSILPEASHLTTPNQVWKHIKKLKNKPTTGPDNIPSILLKHLPRKGVVLLTNIINASIRQKYFPTVWKSSIIIPVPKPNKDISDPKNIRPINLLNNISKIMEKVLLTNLTKTAKDDNILPENQFGFRHKLSTVHAVAAVCDAITDRFNLNKHTEDSY